jgi:hypothetical protein
VSQTNETSIDAIATGLAKLIDRVIDSTQRPQGTAKILPRHNVRGGEIE